MKEGNFENPKELEIQGFKGGSLCGPVPPPIGTRIVVFVCPNKDLKTWKTGKGNWEMKYWNLNRVAIGAGVISVSGPKGAENLSKIRKLVYKYMFTRNLKCLKRPSKPVKPVVEPKPRPVVRPRPLPRPFPRPYYHSRFHGYQRRYMNTYHHFFNRYFRPHIHQYSPKCY